jgi:hypothetical protein
MHETHVLPWPYAVSMQVTKTCIDMQSCARSFRTMGAQAFPIAIDVVVVVVVVVVIVVIVVIVVVIVVAVVVAVVVVVIVVVLILINTVIKVHRKCEVLEQLIANRSIVPEDDGE